MWEKVGRRQPYYFQMEDESPFAFAGIWDEWRGNGVSIASCAIITTTPNQLLAQIHDRMPVILEPHSHDAWLSSGSNPTELKRLLSPFPVSQMTSHAVSFEVNSTDRDSELLVLEAQIKGYHLRVPLESLNQFCVVLAPGNSWFAKPAVPSGILISTYQSHASVGFRNRECSSVTSEVSLQPVINPSAVE